LDLRHSAFVAASHRSAVEIVFHVATPQSPSISGAASSATPPPREWPKRNSGACTSARQWRTTACRSASCTEYVSSRKSSRRSNASKFSPIPLRDMLKRQTAR